MLYVCDNWQNKYLLTGINSRYTNIEIDGVPRHLRNVKRRWMDNFRNESKKFAAVPLQANYPDFIASSKESEPDEVGTVNAELINGDDPVRLSARHRQFLRRFINSLIGSDGEGDHGRVTEFD